MNNNNNNNNDTNNNNNYIDHYYYHEHKHHHLDPTYIERDLYADFFSYLSVPAFENHSKILKHHQAKKTVRKASVMPVNGCVQKYMLLPFWCSIVTRMTWGICHNKLLVGKKSDPQHKRAAEASALNAKWARRAATALDMDSGQCRVHGVDRGKGEWSRHPS